MEKIKILIDTNFLLTMIRYKIHAISEIKEKMPCEFYTLSGVLGEMKVLSKKDKKIKKEVAIANQILDNNNVKIIESTMDHVDNEMVKYCDEYIIATNDKGLREKIRKKDGKSVFIKKLTLVDTSEIMD